MATLSEIRKGVAPKYSLAEFREMMWSCSAYPLAKLDKRKLRRSFRAYMVRGGATPEGAIQYANNELDYAISIYNRKDGQKVDESLLSSLPDYRQDCTSEQRRLARALNNAVRRNDLATFECVLPYASQSDDDPWLDDIARQTIAVDYCHKKLGKAQVRAAMLDLLLARGWRPDRDLFDFALRHHNPEALRVLVAHRLAPDPATSSQVRQACHVMISQVWPAPELWCPDFLSRPEVVFLADRLFASLDKGVPAWWNLHRQSLSTLAISEQWRTGVLAKLCEYAASQVLSLEFERADAQNLLGELVLMDWLRMEQAWPAINAANMSAQCYSRISYALSHASSVAQSRQLSREELVLGARVVRRL